MKTLITLICTCFILSIYAQTSLSDAWLPKIGESYTIRGVEADTIDPGVAGIDVIWDFSNMVGADNDSSDVQFNYLDKNDTPFGDTYPSASIALAAPDVSVYTYYQQDESGAFVEHGSNFGGVLERVYSIPLKLVTIPFNYLDQTSGPYESTATQASITIYSEGDVSITADGFGDLIAPNGGKVYENVLRIKTIRTGSDSTDLGAGLREKLLTRTESYIWTSDDFSVPIVSMSKTETTQIGYFTGIPNDTLQLPDTYSFSFVTDQTSRTKNVVTAEKINLTLQPNPASGQSLLSAELTKGQEINIAIYDLQGRKMMDQKMAGQLGQNNWPLNVASLSNGLYVARLSGTDFESSIKFVKE